MSAFQVEQARNIHVGESHGLTSEPEQADVDFFNSAMQSHSTPRMSGNLSESVNNPLNSQIESVNGLGDKVNHALKNAANSMSVVNMMKVNSTMSQYYLQSALTAKVISKSSQSLDKLTNMQ